MSYNRILKPRAYVDFMQFLYGMGWATPGNLGYGSGTDIASTPGANLIQDDGSTAVTLDSGHIMNLFDGHPNNYIQVAHDTKAFWITLNTGLASPNAMAGTSFIAFLNHNFASADAVIKVEADDVYNMTGTHIITTTGNHTKLINAAADAGSGYIDPAYDGWTLIEYPVREGANNQYIRITIEDDGGAGSNFDEDVIIGSVCWGEFHDFQRVNMSARTAYDYDGVDLVESYGGQTFSNSRHSGPPMWYRVPAWSNYWGDGSSASTYTFGQRTGRKSYSLDFDYLDDSDIFPESGYLDYSATNLVWDDDSLFGRFLRKTLGSHNPFIFTHDSTSTSEGDYGYYRLTDNGFSATQVAHQMWNVGLNFRESW
tara:strand:+ start:248 stop:1354 length:1107 start_codon:yes stop_codon:yes gene_type:complete